MTEFEEAEQASDGAVLWPSEQPPKVWMVWASALDGGGWQTLYHLENETTSGSTIYVCSADSECSEPIPSEVLSSSDDHIAVRYRPTVDGGLSTESEEFWANATFVDEIPPWLTRDLERGGGAR